MLKFISKKFLAMSLVLMLSLLTALPALAGDGDGTGGGKGDSLRLVSSTPASGQQNVSLPVEIHLTFNKNVVNMTVSDINQKCFSLYTAAGSAVPIEVVLADDQVEPEKKRDISLKPLRSLQPGTEYVVRIAPELKSKSGVTLGSEVSIAFTTAAADIGSSGGDGPAVQPSGTAEQGVTEPAPAVVGDNSFSSNGQNSNPPVAGAVTQQETVPDAPTVDNTTADNNTPADTETPAAAHDTEQASASVQTPGQSMNKGILLALGLALVAGAGGYVYMRKRK
ncbi:MAG: Ig-like domain-containing protein [Desulfotomaculaceae bacterium]|nr:Ig-like domain-containing protein [Desulfotomaculaceae bacterium]